MFKLNCSNLLPYFMFWVCAVLLCIYAVFPHLYSCSYAKRGIMPTAVLSFSRGARPLKHGHNHRKNLPASPGPLRRRLPVDGDSSSVRPRAKSGTKLGAAFPGARFFFYLFCPLLLPSSPGHGHGRGHGATLQPVKRQRQPPQRQPAALQTQTLPHFDRTSSLHQQHQQVCQVFSFSPGSILRFLWFVINSFGIFLLHQEQHGGQASLIGFIGCVFLILHASPDSLHQCVAALLQGLGTLRTPPTPIPSQRWGLVLILTWPSSSSPSAARRRPLDRSRYRQECCFSLLSLFSCSRDHDD